MSPPKPSTSNKFSVDELGQNLSNLRTSFHSFVEKLDTTSVEVDDLLNDINHQVGLLTLRSTPSQSKDVTGEKELTTTSTAAGSLNERLQNKRTISNADDVFDEKSTITKSNCEEPLVKRLKYGNKTSAVHSKMTGNQCFCCNDAATLKCEICFQTNASLAIDIPYYCGEDDQNLQWTLDYNYPCGNDTLKLRWKEIRDTEGINKGLPFYVATRELEAGEEIFTKKPLFAFPRLFGKHDFFAILSKFPELLPYMRIKSMTFETCIICHEMMVYGQLMEDPLHGIRLNKCPRCEWPVHSSRDVNLQKMHTTFCQEEHEKECKIFTDNQLMWDKVNKPKRRSWLLLASLRVVINPVLKQKLLNLPLSTSYQYRGIHNFVIKECKQSHVSAEELNKIADIIWSNSLPSYAGYFSIYKKYNYTIYEGGHTGQILPHACDPNCSIYVNPKTGEATFKTRRKIEKNEMLTISYMVDSFPQPINQRAILLLHKGFSRNDHCKCGKCQDGEDRISAVKHFKGSKPPKHQKGCRSSKYLIPFSTRLSPEKAANNKHYKSLIRQQGASTNNRNRQNVNESDEEIPDTSNLFIWQCPSCKSLGPLEQQKVVHEKVEGIREELKHGFTGNSRYKYDELKEIIKKYSDKELHPGHFLMILAQVTLGYILFCKTRMVGISTNERGRSDLHEYLPDVDKAIQMLRRNDNGRSEMYGTLLYCRTLLEMSLLGEKLSTRKKKPTFSKMQTLLQPIMNDLNESWEIMKDNPYLSAVEINRNIQIFELYAKDLEIYAKGLVDSSQKPIFETFRSEQIKSILSKSAFPGYLYLYEVKSKRDPNSLLKMTATDVFGTGEDNEGQMEKIEFKEQANATLGAFLREIFYPAVL